MIRAVGCATVWTEAEMVDAEPTLTISAGFLTIPTHHLLAKLAFLNTAGIADAPLTAMAAFTAAGVNPMLVIAQG
jgi:hypothetical protein